MADKIPARFRKTKTDKWAVMAPVGDLEEALANGGVIEVTRRDGNTSKFNVASLGKPFEVDGVEMCYGYGPDDEAEGATNTAPSSEPSSAAAARPPATTSRKTARRAPTNPQGQATRRPRQSWDDAPTNDPNEPIPEFKGGPEDEWDGGF